jgi:hypothetical protein
MYQHDDIKTIMQNNFLSLYNNKIELFSIANRVKSMNAARSGSG